MVLDQVMGDGAVVVLVGSCCFCVCFCGCCGVVLLLLLLLR